MTFEVIFFTNMKKICEGIKCNGERCSYKAAIENFCRIHAKSNGITKGVSTTSPIRSSFSERREVITLTFGDCAENHAGMQKIGEAMMGGFTVAELQSLNHYFSDHECKTEFVNLKKELLSKWIQENTNESNDLDNSIEEGCLLVVRNGLSKLGCIPEELRKEMLSLKWDTKALFRGVVKNKIARSNLCFDHMAQDACFEQGKGTIIAYNTIPYLQKVRTCLIQTVAKACNKNIDHIVCEGNKYDDPLRNGIGFHGDSERNLVIGIRLGNPSMPLVYQHYYHYKPIGKLFRIDLQDGDIYFMSTKAVGKDWKKSSRVTLRHAAGARKYITPKQK